jgi:rhodanese-related sulfurtransferase
MGRRSGIVLIVATMLAGTLSIRASSAQPSDRSDIQDGVVGGGNSPEVSTAQLRRALAEASAIVLDARPYEEYAVSHIPGARAVRAKPGTTPALYVAEVTDIVESLPDRDQPMIVYCKRSLLRSQRAVCR